MHCHHCQCVCVLLGAEELILLPPHFAPSCAILLFTEQDVQDTLGAPSVSTDC